MVEQGGISLNLLTVIILKFSALLVSSFMILLSVGFNFFKEEKNSYLVKKDDNSLKSYPSYFKSDIVKGKEISVIIVAISLHILPLS